MNSHWLLSVRVNLSRLCSCCDWLFVSNFRNNLRAFSKSLHSSHELSQHTLYFVSHLICLLSTISWMTHFCFTTCAESSWLWDHSRTDELTIITLMRLTFTDNLLSSSFLSTLRRSWILSEEMLEEHERSRYSIIAWEFKWKWVFDCSVEQNALSWASSVSISNLLFFVLTEIFSSLIFMFSF